MYFEGNCRFKREILCISFDKWIKTGMKVNIMDELGFSLGAMLRYVGFVSFLLFWNRRDAFAVMTVNL